LEAFEGAQDTGALKNLPSVGMLYHLAAVASWRLGGEERSRELWRQCLEAAPGFGFAIAHLEDSSRAEGERNGLWAFTLNYFLRREAVEEMVKEAGKTVCRPKSRALQPTRLRRSNTAIRSRASDYSNRRSRSRPTTHPCLTTWLRHTAYRVKL